MKNKIYIKDIDKHDKMIVCHIGNGNQFNKLSEFYPLMIDLSYPHYQIISSRYSGYSYDINDFLNKIYFIVDYDDIIFTENFTENNDNENIVDKIIHILNNGNTYSCEKLHKIKKIVQQYEK